MLSNFPPGRPAPSWIWMELITGERGRGLLVIKNSQLSWNVIISDRLLQD